MMFPIYSLNPDRSLAMTDQLDIVWKNPHRNLANGFWDNRYGFQYSFARLNFNLTRFARLVKNLSTHTAIRNFKNIFDSVLVSHFSPQLCGWYADITVYQIFVSFCTIRDFLDLKKLRNSWKRLVSAEVYAVTRWPVWLRVLHYTTVNLQT